MDDAGGLDALLPPQMAVRAEELGVVKATMPRVRLFVLGMLAGAFIGFGGLLSTVATTGSDATSGPIRLLGGLAFSLGLVLVVVGGAELFTGNNLIVMAWASHRVRTRDVLVSWLVVLVGNSVGALSLALMVFAGGGHDAGNGAAGDRAIAIAAAKSRLTPGHAFWLGVLANALVCLAVWLSYSARTVVDKIVAIIGPVTAFVAAGFEHSIANIYLVPEGLLIERDRGLEVDGLSWSRFVTHNLVPVTIGNLVGGAGLVGLTYWFVYRRHQPHSPQP